MSFLKHRSLGLLLGTLVAASMGGAAFADDTEIFFGQNTGVQPNILLVLDTSGSMETEVVTESAPYDPSTTYTGACVATNVYWLRDSGGVITPPTCTTSNHFLLTAFRCKAALNAFATAGKYAANNAAQYDTGDTRWEQIRDTSKTAEVECAADAGAHGPTDISTAVWATDRSNSKWSTAQADRITWSANNTDRNYVFYSANYLNWYNYPGTIVIKTRLEIMQDVIVDLLSDISGVNVGLMRYSHNQNGDCDDTDDAEGGMVTFPMSDIDTGTARNDMINRVRGYNASGCTPLSETLYEATQYLRGSNVDYGEDSYIRPGSQFLSVPASRQSGNNQLYDSPMDQACQKTFIVYLTDGLPTSDTSADTKITQLPGFRTLVGNSCDGSGDGHCLDDLAAWLNEADLNSTLTGKQNVPSYWIGFGPEVSGSALLQRTADRGGGEFYSADNTTGLAAVLTTIVTEILQTNTSFTAPSVSVNAFNRTQTLSDLYVSVFRPEQTFRWPGNVKKYRVVSGEIRDADNLSAVDPVTGFFRDTARSFWSAADDGQDVRSGGAAHRHPVDPATRRVYTNITAGQPDLTVVGNAFLATNGAISDAVLGVGAAGQPTRVDLIEWMRGRDVQDNDDDLVVTEMRMDMGDPMHAKPAVVIYGGSPASPDADDAVVFSPTNDGMLHAIDVRTGDELWSFMPVDQLDSILDLYEGTIVDTKNYGLDSEVRVLKYDVDQNGVVETGDGDKVFLFFGQGRGGSNIYALDVTTKSSPRHLWTVGPSQLPNIGQTWSAPILSRVHVSGATQNSQKLVLIFGGGYDDTQDTYTYNTDTSGNAVFMVDALSGARLWYATNTGSDRPLPRMVHSISSNLSVLDLDGDTFADRIYAGDMGGLLWRFDIYNGNTVANLVTGGVIADLGAAAISAPKPLSETRRLYNTPDVALMRRRGRATFFNIAMGSGYRGHPLDDRTYDRFYAVRDYLPFTKRTQAEYDAVTPILDGNLVNVTDSATASVADNAPGWKLELRLPGGWVGEKVLAESRTFNGSIFFPTYLPNQSASANSCTPASGRNRVYIVKALDGSPVLDLDGDGGDDGVSADPDGDGNPNYNTQDRFTGLDQGGIAPETIMLFPGRNDAGDDDGDGVLNGDDADDDGDGEEDEDDPVVCLNGAEVLGACTNFNSRLRTFWRESAAN